jgi:hypothetical protein
MVLAAAAELPPLQLDDALEVLALMADQSPPERYRAAAARWCGRLAVEQPASLSEPRLASAGCELLSRSTPKATRAAEVTHRTRRTVSPATA